MILFCDIGIKHFCYLICNQQKKIFDFETLAFSRNTTTSVIDLFEKIREIYQLENVFIESQIFKNASCLKIETIISTYLTLKNIPFKMVQSSKKYRVLEMDSEKKKIYRERKKFVVEKGEELLKKTEVEKTVVDKIQQLKKKDDFYDCVLMMFTEI